MGRIVKTGAWCNGEVAYLAWQADAPIADCLGFMITRIHEDGQRRILPTWIAFTDQSNPDWLNQDSSVWPIQQYEWRDLTLRRSRDTAAVRPIDFKVKYEIRPVGLARDGLEAVPVSDTAPYQDQAGQPRGTDPPPLLVADHDLVGGDGPAAVEQAGDPGYLARGRRAMVGRADLDADRDSVRPGVQRRAQRAQCLREHA